ncbi:MAG: hypothetical protein G01um101429_168 [Parcubacteria group bacterium Gr01-1014_29]|nr:MAG: hypothetical protein G01um101429_168 [Parcubacteria group bacterium Gr01-1014_29]
MSGHSKWSQIKHKKGATDAKRSKTFSQLSHAITLAAREKGQDPGLNPTLRTAIENAQAVNMPKDTIDRAITKATSPENTLMRVTYEAYGPGGVALVIEGSTDNNNRTFAQIRTVLETHGAKMAPGGALWAFVKEGEEWIAKTTVPVDDETRKKIDELAEVLEEHEDIQEVYTNTMQNVNIKV